MPRYIGTESRRYVIKLYQYFEWESQNGGPLLPLTRVAERVSGALGVSTRTISRILKEQYDAETASTSIHSVSNNSKDEYSVPVEQSKISAAHRVGQAIIDATKDNVNKQQNRPKTVTENKCPPEKGKSAKRKLQKKTKLQKSVKSKKYESSEKLQVTGSTINDIDCFTIVKLENETENNVGKPSSIPPKYIEKSSKNLILDTAHKSIAKADFKVGRLKVDGTANESEIDESDDDKIDHPLPEENKPSTGNKINLEAICRHVQEYHRRSQVPTARTLLISLNEAGLFSGSKDALLQIMADIGFKFKFKVKKSSVRH